MGSFSETELQDMKKKGKEKMEMEMEMERYIMCLEQEVRKIEVFRKELPLSMELLSSAIQASKRELRDCTENEGLGRPQLGPTSNCKVKPPILVPHKALTFCTPDHDYDRAQKRPVEVTYSSEEQVCNTYIPASGRLHCDLISQYSRDQLFFSKNKDGGAFSQLFCQDRHQGDFSSLLPKDGIQISFEIESGKNPQSLTFNNNNCVSKKVSMIHDIQDQPDHSIVAQDNHKPNQKTEEGNISNIPIVLSQNSGRNRRYSSTRKRRRCWSPELHNRFINALQCLGGPKVATPKRIRQLMNVDGLTNDEVKSHLQKHRLNKRQPNGSATLGEIDN